jgi:ribosomal protein S12 methylthiotransferase accessory factor
MRLIDPEETLERVAPLLPVMGITRIANVTGLDTLGIPVVMVSRPNSRSISVAQGKGPTLAAAKASGVMESIESYHAEHITLPLKLASYEELRYSHRCVDVERLPRLRTSGYTPFRQMLWIEGLDLMSGKPAWVPFEMVSLNFAAPLPAGPGCFQAGSNGLASGNHILEAIVHAVAELIERDAATLWHLLDEAAQDRARLDLATVDDPVCRELLAKLQRGGVCVGVWELTSDIGVPTFQCRIISEEGPPGDVRRPGLGAGCHPSRAVALSRALTEAAQSRLTFISGARDDIPRFEYQDQLDPAVHARWMRRIRGDGPGRAFNAAPSHAGRDLEDELRWLLDRLVGAGIEEVVVVDLTRAEFSIPVARVIIPGLEGVDASTDYLLGARARERLAAARVLQ